MPDEFYLGACHRPKHRDGARRFASDTPQVLYWAYISEFDRVMWKNSCMIPYAQPMKTQKKIINQN